MFAKIIAIEGPDKTGKATQSKMLAHTLRRYGDRVVRVEVLWNDRLTHPLLYSMLRSGSARRHPNLFQFVHFINKFIFQSTYLLWLWLTCDFVVLDRWKTSAMAYGIASQTNFYLSWMMYKLIVSAHLTCVLHGPSRKRNTIDDSYERDQVLQDAVRTAYYNWVELNPLDHELIDSQGTRDEVHDRITTTLTRFAARTR